MGFANTPAPRRASSLLRVVEPTCRVEGAHGADDSLPKVSTSIRIESEVRVVHVETTARRLSTARVDLRVECSRCKYAHEYVDFALARICPTCRTSSAHGIICGLDFDPRKGPPRWHQSAWPSHVFEWILLDAGLDPLRAAMEGSLLATAYEAYYLATANLSREANVREHFLEAWTYGPLAAFKGAIKHAGTA